MPSERIEPLNDSKCSFCEAPGVYEVARHRWVCADCLAALREEIADDG